MKVNNSALIKLATVGLVPFAQAQDGIKIGDAVLSPFVGASLTYDDNVFKTADKDPDTFLEYSVGTKLSKKSDSAEFDSSVWFSERKYDSIKEKDDKTRFGAALMGKLTSDKSYLIASAAIREVMDYDAAPAYGVIPKGFEGIVDKGFDRTASDVERRVYDAGLAVGQDFSDVISLSAAYGFYAVDYIEGDLNGWYENAIGAEASVALTDKSDAFLNVQQGFQDGDGVPDGARFTTARLGFKTDVTDRTSFRAGIGAVAYNTDSDEFFKPSFELRGEWRATDKVLFFVDGRNEIQPTGTNNQNSDEVQLSNRLNSGVLYQPMDRLALAATAGYVYDKILEGSGEPTSKEIMGAFRASYFMTNGFDFFAQVECGDVKSDRGSDYTRFSSSIGVNYKF